jgi:colicin import membrane protein
MLSKYLLPDLSHLFSVEDAGGEGGSGGGGTPPPAPDEGKPAGDGGENEKTFTQADVDKAASARAAEARRKATADLAEQLGVSVEEAKKIIAASKSAEESQKTEAQRAKEAADQAKREAEEAKAEAARERQAAQVERALIKSRVRDDCLEDSLALLKVDAEASPEEITAAVEAFTQRRPEFFDTDSGDGSRRTPPPGDPKGKPAPKKAEDAFARGEERAKQMRNSTGYPILEQAK